MCFRRNFMIKFAIIDDDSADIDHLREKLKQYFGEDEFQSDCFSDGVSFLSCNITDYDVIFLDVEMTPMDGFAVAEEIRKVSEDIILIFTTKMAQLARHGYKYCAFDYLIKPIEYSELSMTLDRAPLQAMHEEDRIVLLPGKDRDKVPMKISEINYLEVNGHYITFHTSKGDFVQYGVFKKVLEEINLPSSFVRCNQSYVVNLAKIEQIFKDTLVVGGDTIAISRPQRKQFFENYSAYILGRRTL